MEYALSYALINWKKIDPKGDIVFDNLRTHRMFVGNEDENGFIMVHVAMDSYTGRLVKAAEKLIQSAAIKDRASFNQAFKELNESMKVINSVFSTMWYRSQPSMYNSFRTFIMGTKNQPMFPNGVIYEGVSSEPVAYRGESGANDSIIPTVDNLLEIYDQLPNNPLTEILTDFRTYRPLNHT